MTTQPMSKDIAVIGAGPAGLFTVFEAGMLGMSCAVIEALPEIGGQCSALYPEKPIYDIPAFPEISAGGLIQNLEKQAAPFSPHYITNRQAAALEQHGSRWHITTDKGDVIDAGAVIIAAGGGAFAPNRPPLEHIRAYEGTSVFYSVTDTSRMKDKHVVIAGGGDSAADWSVALCDIAASVTILHRRKTFRCAPETAAKMEALAIEKRIRIAAPFQAASLEGDIEQGTLTGVRIRSIKGDVEETLQADIFLPFFGLASDLGPVASWGLGTEKKHLSVAADTMSTDSPGIFAVGDICTYPGKLKLILTGFSEAALAAHSARAHLFPEKVFRFEYSTSTGVGSTTEYQKEAVS